MTITDWYLDVSNAVSITPESLIYLDALKPHDSAHWDLTTPEMKTFKTCLLKDLKVLQDNRCAYCGLGLTRVLVDREHFVAKGKPENKPQFMFCPENLFAACAYCNRILKGRKKIIASYNDDYSQCSFKIIHPLYDCAANEIFFDQNSKGDFVIIQALTQKGLATIRLFDLDSPAITVKRVGFIAEKKAIEEMPPEELARLKVISFYRPK